MSNTSTRSGRTTVPSSPLTEAREHAAAMQAAERATKKRRAPAQAPPPRPRAKASVNGASSTAAPVAKLTQEEIQSPPDEGSQGEAGQHGRKRKTASCQE